METTLTSRVALAARAESKVELRAEDFEELVRLHQRRIYRVLLAWVRDPDTADTLTQECFLRAYKKRASFRGESSVGTWLVRIALNLARDHAKNRRQHFWQRLYAWVRDEHPTQAAEQAAAPQVSADKVLAMREDVAAVWSASDELPAQQRAVFVLRFAEEMTLGEIAATMELEVGTVKAHLHRAVYAVRKKLKRKATETQRQREEEGRKNERTFE